MPPKASKPVQPRPTWGRVLIAGGTNWASNGKGNVKRNEAWDLSTPHILRSLSHFKITKIMTAANANYAIAIDIQGIAHMIGKLPAMSGDPKGVVPIFEAVHVSPRVVGSAKDVKWVDGAVARGHFLLLDSEGGVYGAGQNMMGQIGLPAGKDVHFLKKVSGPWGGDKIIQVTAGNGFSLYLSDKGNVYAAGSTENGQLGNGTTGEHITMGNKLVFENHKPMHVVFPEEAGKIVKISSGPQHSLALDDQGFVYGWGFDGYCRLGLGDQKNKLVPTVIPQFADTNPLKRASDIRCGPHSSVIIDRQGLFQIAGRWKTTGDGGGGAPYTSFKYVDEISGCKVASVAVGGCTHFITTFLDAAQTKVQTIGWGQGAAYGELGLGDGPKSSTKPVEITTLCGADIIDIAAGMCFTLFLAHPNKAIAELERIPLEIESEPVCLVCHVDRPNSDDLLECERCDAPYHPDCLTPPLKEVPEGAWFCPECTEDSLRTFDDVVFERTPSAPPTSGTMSKRGAESQGSNGGKRTRTE